MPTKAELEEAVESLVETNEELAVRLEETEAVNEDLVTELEKLQLEAQEKLPADCINCGQSSQKIEIIATGDSVVYHCPVCDHNWTQEHEAAPFRAIRNKEA